MNTVDELSPQLRQCLADALARGKPDLADPATANKILVREGEGSPGNLRLFPELRLVWLERWSRVSVAELVDEVPALSTLGLWECEVSDLSALSRATRLEDIEVRRGLVTDLSPIVDLPNLRWCSIVGCPLDERSYREILPALDARGVKRLYPFPEREWRMCRALHARGLRVSAFPDAYGKTRLLVPGWDREGYGTIVLTEEQLERILHDHPDLDTARFMAVGRRVFHEALEAKRAARARAKQP